VFLIKACLINSFLSVVLKVETSCTRRPNKAGFCPRRGNTKTDVEISVLIKHLKDG
jgi:hypothetical protein